LQEKNPDSIIQLPEQGVLTICNSNELIIGGIYIRLFNSNPGWTMRKPVAFLTDLFGTFIKLMHKSQVSSILFSILLLKKYMFAKPKIVFKNERRKVTIKKHVIKL
jgi:hypothetical protein